MPDFDIYQSPFSWRYSSTEMRRLWSEQYKRQLWRKIWTTLAAVQAEFGLVTPEQVAELEAHIDAVDIERAHQIEAEIHHDLMAELKTFAEQCPLAAPILHTGATSMDIEDNADALRIRAALAILLARLQQVLLILADQIILWADTPCIAFTHLQPAEPTTLGYRLAGYAQDLLDDWRHLSLVKDQIKGKGFKGAVGTGAAFTELFGLENLDTFEDRMSSHMGIGFFPITNQTYPRKQDYLVVSTLASLGASLYKLAFDLRLLQSPLAGEVSEPFRSQQVGSSAMPFKRNPIHCEKIDSLARALCLLPQLAWQNAAHSLLERTLDDSANRRIMLPEAFLICDEILITTQKITKDLKIDTVAMQRNLAAYAPFAGLERLMVTLVKAGANRQEMHARLRRHSLTAWENLSQEQPNPLIMLLESDHELRKYISPQRIAEILEVESYTGNASQRAKKLAEGIFFLFPVA